MSTLPYMAEAREKRGERVEITEDQFYYMRDVLPPVYARGVAAMGEVANHNANGDPIYYWFAEYRDKFFCFYSTREAAEKQFMQDSHDDQRRRYMTHEITHAEFYCWLADRIGVKVSDLPVSLERIAKSTDPHLNDIPLKLWDNCDFTVRTKSQFAGMRSWSLSDTVCCLKSFARREAQKAEVVAA